MRAPAPYQNNDRFCSQRIGNGRRVDIERDVLSLRLSRSGEKHRRHQQRDKRKK